MPLEWTGQGCDVCGFGTVEDCDKFDPTKPCPECGEVNVPNVPLETLQRLAQPIAHIVDRALPQGAGFVVLLFNFGDGSDGHITYVSNAERKYMRRTLAELLLKWDADERAEKGKSE